MGVDTSLVMTVLAEDRPGLVEKVSSVITSHQGNWLESHLSTIAGHFGGIVHVLVPKVKAAALTMALQELVSEGLFITVRPAAEGLAATTHQEVKLEVLGNDRPGIINRISQAMASQGVNVYELETEYRSAPMSGTAMFEAHARLDLPANVSAAAVKYDLEKIAHDLMVDITLE